MMRGLFVLVTIVVQAVAMLAISVFLVWLVLGALHSAVEVMVGPLACATSTDCATNCEEVLDPGTGRVLVLCRGEGLGEFFL